MIFVRLIGFLFIFFGLMSESFGKVSLSGYMDFEYVSRFGEKPQSDPEFDQHRISMIFQHEVENYRFLSELEWEHAADISADDGGTATGDGDILVERAWGEMLINRYFNVRMGVILNSTYYQQNHFPSIIVNFTAPQMYKKIFDASYEGIKFYGNLPFDLEYDLWVTRDPKQRNGGSPNTENGGLSKGGRLAINKSVGMDLDVYAALLYADFRVSSGNDFRDRSQKSFGIDTAINYKNFTLWSEWGERIDDEVSTNNKRGLYSILSYSIQHKEKEIIPFFMYDKYRLNSASVESIERFGLGVTYRPIPVISFKAEYLQTPSYMASLTNEVLKAEQIGLVFVYFFN